MGERTAPSGDDDRLLIALAAGLRVSADAADAGRGGARSGGGASDGGSDAAWSDAPPDGDGEPEAQLAKRPPHPRPTSLLDSGWSGYSASLPPEAAAPASDPWRAAFGAGGGLPRPMRTFPAPSPAADVAPLSAPAPPSELLFPAIARFFEVFHPLFPVVHKATFEASLAGQPSPVYAGTRPLALAYAAAAVGAFHLPAEPEQARVRFARLCCDRARDLLLAGRASPVEEAFALALILNVMLVAGVPGRMAHPLQRCGRLAEALYLSLPEEPPSTPDEWVYREQVLRLRIFYCAFDLGAAFNAGRPALSSYFHPHRSPLPCGEAFFDHPFPGAAFDALTSWRESEGGEPCVRYPAKDWREISGTFSHLSSLSASPSGSVLCALMLSNYVRHLRMALGRSDASSPLNDRRTAAGGLVGACDAALRALPPDLGTALSQGDPAPLLRSRGFADPAHAYSLLHSHLFSEVHVADRLHAAGFRASCAARHLRLARCLEQLLRADPPGDRCHHVLMAPAYVAGRYLLADLVGEEPRGPDEGGEGRERRRRELGRGVRAVGRFLERLGRVYGLQPRKVARAFAGDVAAAGFGPGGPAPLPEDSSDLQEDDGGFVPGPPEGGEEARFFGDVLLSGKVRWESFAAGKGGPGSPGSLG